MLLHRVLVETLFHLFLLDHCSNSQLTEQNIIYNASRMNLNTKKSKWSFPSYWGSKFKLLQFRTTKPTFPFYEGEIVGEYCISSKIFHSKVSNFNFSSPQQPQFWSWGSRCFMQGHKYIYLGGYVTKQAKNTSYFRFIYPTTHAVILGCQLLNGCTGVNSNVLSCCELQLKVYLTFLLQFYFKF